MEPVTILGGRDMTATEDSSTVEKTKGTGGITPSNKAQANTSRPEQGLDYQILDTIFLEMESPFRSSGFAPCLAFSSLSFLLAYLALVLVTLLSRFFSG